MTFLVLVTFIRQLTIYPTHIINQYEYCFTTSNNNLFEIKFHVDNEISSGMFCHLGNKYKRAQIDRPLATSSEYT
jgi:hypothetical protein